MRLHTPLLALAAVAALAGCDVPSAPDSVVYGVLSATIYKSDQATGQPDPLFAAPTTVYLENTIPVIDDTNSGVVITQPVIDGVIGQLRTNLEARGYTVTVRNPGDPTPPAGTLRMGAYCALRQRQHVLQQLLVLLVLLLLLLPDYELRRQLQLRHAPRRGRHRAVHPGPAARVRAPPRDQPPHRASSIWTAASYGVFAGSATVTTSSPGYPKALASIDQAFAQSPYFTSAP